MLRFYMSRINWYEVNIVPFHKLIGQDPKTSVMDAIKLTPFRDLWKPRHHNIMEQLKILYYRVAPGNV